MSHGIELKQIATHRWVAVAVQVVVLDLEELAQLQQNGACVAERLLLGDARLAIAQW